MQRRGLIVGNWKMNGTVAFARELAGKIHTGLSASGGKPACDVVICPPFTALVPLQVMLVKSPLQLGGQNISKHDNGAHTGEICGHMLRDAGCGFVIVGHSERRANQGETSHQVASKMAAAYKRELTPIVCLGETLAERDQGRTLEVVGQQLRAIFPRLPDDGGQRQQLVLAYEPVWAIGTGRTATPEQAQEVHGFLRKELQSRMAPESAQIRILYGGSVKPDNADTLFSKEDVDGGLIGGASLNAADFLAIIDAFPKGI